MPKLLLLSLAACVLVLAHVCAGDLSIRWAYNIPNAQILERLDVSTDQSFVVSSVNLQNGQAGAFLYAFSANPSTISGSLLWSALVHSEVGLLGRPSISPDGNFVAVGCQTCLLTNAFVFSINGNAPSLVWSQAVQSPQGISNLNFEGIPAWRPDSSFVYFQDVQYGNVIEVQISSKTITGRASIVGPGFAGAPSPTMSPDGKFLFVCSASTLYTGVLNSYALPMLNADARAQYFIPLDNPCASTAHISKTTNTLYFGDSNGTYAVDITNGKLTRKWYYAGGFNVYAAPAVVYYTSVSSPSLQVNERF
jgi:hypothetical protein